MCCGSTVVAACGGLAVVGGCIDVAPMACAGSYGCVEAWAGSLYSVCGRALVVIVLLPVVVVAGGRVVPHVHGLAIVLVGEGAGIVVRVVHGLVL